MKKGLLLSVGLLSIVAMSTTQAGGFYVTGKIGYSDALDFDSAPREAAPATVNGVDIDFDSDFIYGAAIGYQFHHQGMIVPRIEFEYLHAEYDIDQISAGTGRFTGGNLGDFELDSFMLNGFVDFDLGNCFKPYAGMGIGIADVEANGRYSSPVVRYQGSDDVFALHGILGVSYDITKQVNIFLEGRYLALNNPEFRRVTSTNTTNHRGDFETVSAVGGIRYTFS